MLDLMIRPDTISPLALLILYLVGLGYLLSIQDKSTATRWLIAVFFGLALFALTNVVQTLSYFPRPQVKAAWDFVFLVGTGLFLWGYLHFTYRFLGNPFRREARIVLWASSLLLILDVGAAGYQALILVRLPESRGVLGVLHPALLLLFLTGATVVLVRKWRHAARAAESGPERRAAPAFRAYALLNGLLIVFLTFIVLGTATALNSGEGILLPVGLGCQLGFFFGLVVVYLNHAPEPASFQVKLIGLSLVTVLALLSIAPAVIYPDMEAAGARPEMPEHEALRFMPDGAGGYTVTALPYVLDPDIGDNLYLTGGTDTTVTLSFAFPFYGEPQQEIVIENDPILLFGGALDGFNAFYTSELPMIVPLMTNLAPAGEGGVYLRQDSGRVVVTWHEAPIASSWLLDDNAGTATVQAVLHADGTIDFVYGDIAEAWIWVRGLTPGGAPPELEATWLPEPTPYALPPGAPRIERITQEDPPEQEALRFTPDGNGGYEVANAAYHFDDAPGEDLHMADDSARAVELGFAFPFGETTWGSLYVSPNGAVSFGAPLYRAGPAIHNAFLALNEVPKIAPLSVDLDPSAGGSVFVRREPGRAAITWHDVPQFQTMRRNTFQLVLHQSGAVEMVYDHVGADLQRAGYNDALRALVPGGLPGYVREAALHGLPHRIAPGESHIEDFLLTYRQRTHEAMLPMVWLMLAATAFILVVFPFFFRSSLVKPLDRLRRGVQRVNEGDLDAEVPVGVSDEIGYLTYHFNRMTQSLRRYNGEMEALVAERTAALEQSVEDLKAAQQQLVHAEKMASLGALTAGIAHEIKNPLNFITNFAGLSRELVEELKAETDPEEIQALLADLELNASKIEEHGQRADGIVRAMMQHARGGEGQCETVDLNALVDEYVDLAYHGKRAQTPDFNVEIIKKLEDEVGRVDVVPQEIGRVLLNLIGNAFDAVYERASRINGRYAPTVTVTTRRVGDAVEIGVADNGPGIPEKVRDRIFEPFFTTKPTGSGTGLGLSMSYDIVTQGHGGSLHVESKEGNGTAFVVTLPGRIDIGAPNVESSGHFR